MSDPYVPGLGITNIYIDKFLTTYCDLFHGVFSAEELVSMTPEVGQYVLTESRRSRLLSHFVAVIVSDTEILYFDSFGIECTNPSILKFLEKYDKPIRYNETTLQAMESFFCGFFCILMCLYYSKPRSWKMNFSKNLIKNDFICIKYINKCIQDT